MDQESFQKAFKQGLGRVILHLKSQEAMPYREIIVHGCTHDLAYDSQCEESREVYLFEIIQATGETDYYRNQLFAALTAPKEDEDIHQMFALTRMFAQHGDARARQVMYLAFAQNAAYGDFGGAIELIKLDGLEGFLFVIERYLQRMDKDISDADWWIYELEDRDGEEAAWKALERAAMNLSELAMLLTKMKQERAAAEVRRESFRKRPVPTYADFQALLTKANGRYAMVSWGKRAGEADAERVAEELLVLEEEQNLPSYLHAFAKRRFPCNPERLLPLANHANEEIAQAALRALRNIPHESVRALALQLIPDTRWCV